MIKQNISTFYLNSKPETVIIESDIDYVFESICSTIIPNIKKCLGTDSGCIIDSVLNNNINFLKYNPSVGSSYIKLPK